MVIGGDAVIYSPTGCYIDETRPWMIEIGCNVSVTESVTILAHGYDWSVFKGKYGDVLGSAGHVRIEDNVFIGMNSTILKGVEIGDNVVIGAGSVVTKSIPPDSVTVGDPCCVIADIDSYLEKRRAAQMDEAADLYDCWCRNSPEARRGGCLQERYLRSFSGCSSREERMSSRTRPSKRRRGCAGRSTKARPFSSARNLALPVTRSFCRNSRSVADIKASCMGIWMLTTQ
jgi:carbonic anhydrase/acetyltransferase-like protein (isoleucine patch superfamily)